MVDDQVRQIVTGLARLRLNHFSVAGLAVGPPTGTSQQRSIVFTQPTRTSPDPTAINSFDSWSGERYSHNHVPAKRFRGLPDDRWTLCTRSFCCFEGIFPSARLAHDLKHW
jgi:hypothetical protein